MLDLVTRSLLEALESAYIPETHNEGSVESL